MSKLSVYKQLCLDQTTCKTVLAQEIGMKTNCMPFVLKVMNALESINGTGNYALTEKEAFTAANTFLSGMQTLMQGGILPEDYDKLDFVRRGKTIVPSARVEAFFRAAARKGYRITETIIPVPKEDAFTTYFRENRYNGEIVYDLEDLRKNPDRGVTAERLVNDYFSKFICRLEIFDVRAGKRLHEGCVEVTNEDMLKIASASEQGIYASHWEEYKDRGRTKKRKVFTTEINKDGFWYKWTGEMVNKSIIRRALKRIKEVLPELKDTIYAFESDDDINIDDGAKEIENTIEIPLEDIKVQEEAPKVNLDNLSEVQMEDCKDKMQIYISNPKQAQIDADEIEMALLEGKSVDDVVEQYYPELYCIRQSQKLKPKFIKFFPDWK